MYVLNSLLRLESMVTKWKLDRIKKFEYNTFYIK